jgi:hypothetical protein
MNTTKFITDIESVELSRIGELKIEDRPVLNLACDMRTASGLARSWQQSSS